jgi:hypothetical protein
MAGKSNSLVVSKPEFLKTTSGIEEFLQLETQLEMTMADRDLASSSLLQSNVFKSPQKTAKADSPQVKSAKSAAHLKHHYPVTPLVFSKATPEGLSQLKNDLSGSNQKTNMSGKPSTRRLESANERKKCLVFDDSDRKRQISNNKKEVQRFNSDKKPDIAEIIHGHRSPKKGGVRPNSSVLSLNQERLSLRDTSSSKNAKAKPSIDLHSQLLKSEAHRSSTQKSRKIGNSSQLNASVSQTIEKDMDQATRHKLQSKVRQFYQNQLAKVSHVHLDQPQVQ